MRLNVLHAELLDVIQRIRKKSQRCVRHRPDLEVTARVRSRGPIHNGVSRRVVRKCVILHSRKLTKSVLAAMQPVEQILAYVKESETHVAHEPLVTGAGAEVDAARSHIEGNSPMACTASAYTSAPRE